MINVGIDVHKKKCFATVKGSSREVLREVIFGNNSAEMLIFIGDIKEQYDDQIRAVCESTANYWIRLHDTKTMESTPYLRILPRRE